MTINPGDYIRLPHWPQQYKESEMAKREYEVTIPIAGHAFLTVVANSEEEAVEVAMGEVTLSHVDRWEPLEQFNRGNVCYCPRPWKAEVSYIGPDE